MSLTTIDLSLNPSDIFITSAQFVANKHLFFYFAFILLVLRGLSKTSNGMSITAHVHHLQKKRIATVSWYGNSIYTIIVKNACLQICELTCIMEL